MRTALPLIGITMGDPAGIGPEVCLKLAASPKAHEACRPLVIGDVSVLRHLAERYTPDLSVNPIAHPAEGSYRPGTIDVVDRPTVNLETLPVGQISREAGAAAGDYIITGARLAMEGAIDGLLTGPANKAALSQAGFHYSGQAEFFQELTGAKQFITIIMQGDVISGLLTTHLSLADACAKVKKDRILRYLQFLHENRFGLGLQQMRIGVAALNPHGGDNGLFGREEIDEIAPAVVEARAVGVDANGPIPAQDIFRQAARGKWDVVLAMFHDQAAIAMDVNFTTTVTLGLPILRTSVGHGTAFDIAWKGIADPAPLLSALADTARLATHRRKLLNA